MDTNNKNDTNKSPSPLSSVTKHCKKCDENKPLECFNYKNKVRLLQKSICKICEKTYNADRYQSKKGYIKEQSQNWKDTHKEQYLEYQKVYNKVHRQKGKEKLDKSDNNSV